MKLAILCSFLFLTSCATLHTPIKVEDHFPLYPESYFNAATQNEITNLLNLEFEMSEDERLKKLEKYIQDQIVKDFDQVNNIDDIKRLLEKRSHLNNIPLVVKEYFNINN
jgi:hypothetical protein